MVTHLSKLTEVSEKRDKYMEVSKITPVIWQVTIETVEEGSVKFCTASR